MILQRKIVYSKLDETIFKITRDKKKTRKKNPIDSLLYFIAKYQVKRPGLVIIMVFILTILIIPGFGLVYTDFEGENWIPEGDDILESFQDVAFNFGGVDSLNLIFALDRDVVEYSENTVRDLRDSRVMQKMSSLDVLVEKLEWVDSVDSPTNDIKRINQGRVPQDSSRIKSLIEDNPDIRGRFNSDYSLALFTVRAGGIDRDDFYELMREVESLNFPEGVTIIPQGGVPEDIELEKMFSGDTQQTTLIGFGFIIILASLFYSSIVSGLLAFFPIIFAIIWTVGIMGYINLPFTVLTTGMLALLMGIGIDYSIHLIHSIRKGLNKHDNLEEAIPEALMSTGQAIAITTLTTFVGFMALSFASLVNTKRLGWTLALGIVSTFFSCMLIVPAVLAIQFKLRNRGVKK